MTRTILAAILGMLMLLPAAADAQKAPAFGNERLDYKVMFKWGLVNKQAGRATLCLHSEADYFRATLYARSESWADHFYSLRDTLTSTMRRSDMLPVRYERIAHEDGKYARDIITMTINGELVTGHSVRYRRGRKTSSIGSSEIMLEAKGPTVDLLSVFYYIRTIDFDHLKQGNPLELNIFSGKRNELLTIRWVGDENITIDGRSYATHRISFKFTDENRSKSSDDIDTWIKADSSRIPLKLEGKLKVGKIRCLYTGPK